MHSMPATDAIACVPNSNLATTDAEWLLWTSLATPVALVVAALTIAAESRIREGPPIVLLEIPVDVYLSPNRWYRPTR